jgi:hypothetical protein
LARWRKTCNYPVVVSLARHGREGIPIPYDTTNHFQVDPAIFG